MSVQTMKKANRQDTAFEMNRAAETSSQRPVTLSDQSPIFELLIYAVTDMAAEMTCGDMR